MINFSAELNAEQLAVVQQGDGPCLVLAGAGSGKTRTITYRVAYLLERGIKPENILLVTFTNKAAEQMKERLRKLETKKLETGNKVEETRNSKLETRERDSESVGHSPISNFQFPISHLWSGTFHHIAYRILRVYAPLLGYTNKFTVLDNDDSQAILKLCIKEIKNTGAGQRFPSANVVGSIISYSRNAEIPVDQIIESRYYQWIQFADDIKMIAGDYGKRKKEANVMDFDDLLTNFLLLLNDEKIRNKYATQFQYILVDEYQDTNKIQASIIRQLASVHKNVLVVGDDAQSIYSFRAADIHNILGFELTYPGAKVFKLETNYRSTKPILDVANNVIANNHEQYKKELRVAENTVTDAATVGTGRDLSLQHGQRNPILPQLYPQLDQQTEAVFIAKKIEEYLKEGIEPKEIAVLFRAAHHSQMLEVELVQRGIAYDYRGGVRFFERAHIKDILAYLRILNNPADTAAWLRVLMHEEGIGPAAAQKVIEAIRSTIVGTGRDLSLQPGAIAEIGARVLGGKALAGWDNFVKIWNAITGAYVNTPLPAPLIKSLLGSPYRDYLESEYIDSHDRLGDIKQLAIFAERFEALEEFLAATSLQESFRVIANETSPPVLSSAEERKNRSLSPRRPSGREQGVRSSSSQDKIILSTIHQAKGLEWSAVFILNLSSGAFPSERSLQEDNGLEEERRLFYVAITRAKKYLYLTYPMSGGSYGDFLSGPSLFLNEIYSELLDDHSLLSTNSTILDDLSEDIHYVNEDEGRPKKIKPGSFLVDIDDL